MNIYGIISKVLKYFTVSPFKKYDKKDGIPLILTLPDKNFIEPNTQISISGWGRTGDNKIHSTSHMCINMSPIFTKECQIYRTEIDDNTTFCAIGESLHNVCVGDSGGAAIYYRYGDPIHVGVLSFLQSSGCELNSLF